MRLTRSEYRPSSVTRPASMTKTFSARAIELNRCATRMTVIFLDAKIVEIAALTCCSAVGGMKEER